jgi:NAD(P)-dependent dehydrogenase (short-subunit alcohol dehydrogenase family)
VPALPQEKQMGGLVEGKVVLVTGAASGIGRASALVFAREGAKVVACDIDEKGGDETLGLVREAGGEGEFLRTDVAREEQVEALVAYAVERFGRLDCAHNNAGITGAVGAVHQIDLAGWERTLTVNLTSVFLCMKHEIRVMLEQGGGAVVNTASGAGFVPTPTLSPYCASKHGILGLTKTAAVENARTGIRVNAVCPGSIDTPMLRAYMKDPQIEKLIRAGQPGGRLGDPAEIAEAAVWLCSDRASFVSGESMLVDGAAIAR